MDGAPLVDTLPELWNMQIKGRGDDADAVFSTFLVLPLIFLVRRRNITSVDT